LAEKYLKFNFFPCLSSTSSKHVIYRMAIHLGGGSIGICLPAKLAWAPAMKPSRLHLHYALSPVGLFLQLLFANF
jgi:hypothetical protein